MVYTKTNNQKHKAIIIKLSAGTSPSPHTHVQKLGEAVETGRGRESPSPHQRGQPRALLGGNRAVIVGGRGRGSSLGRGPKPAEHPTEGSRQGLGVRDSLSISLSHLPRWFLNFSRGALDSGALGLEPGSWRPQVLKTVGQVFSEKIRPGKGTKVPWDPGG